MHAVTVDIAVKESLNAIWKTYARDRISEESAKAKALLELAESGLEIVDEKSFSKGLLRSRFLKTYQYMMPSF